jgi:hypothetical protein
VEALVCLFHVSVASSLHLYLECRSVADCLRVLVTVI